MNTFSELTASIDALRNNLVELIEEAQKHISGEKENQFVPRVELLLSDFTREFINQLGKEAKLYTNGGWKELRPKVQDLKERSERLSRRMHLIAAPTLESFQTTLCWFAEQGETDDLDLLRIASHAYSGKSGEIDKLMEFATEQIRRRAERLPLTEPETAASAPTENAWRIRSARRYAAMSIVEKLERLESRLAQIKQLPRVNWETFSASILHAQYEMKHRGARNAIQILEKLFDDSEELANFLTPPPAPQSGGGLYSAYKQTPMRMNESLVRQRNMLRDIDSSYMTELLTTLVQEIQILEESTA
ncbi:MAG: hypothetical protein KDA77_13415 [Planctomycetaceae bacterium]|nr:hypothetical protein [Planctomycetaceae bacterium]